MPTASQNAEKLRLAKLAGTIIPAPGAPSAGSPPVLPPTGGMDPLLRSPLPSSYSTNVDQLRAFESNAIPQHTLPPQPALADQSANASSASIANSAVAPVSKVANAAQTTATTANNTANSAIAKTFQGAWVSTATYAVGASVDFGGAIYLCILGNTNQTPPNATYWSLLSGTASYAGAWSSVVSYTVGQVVSVSSSLYIALQNSTNENPASTSSYWQLLTGASIYTGAWSSATQYSVGQTVSYTDGNFYIAISANINVAPAAIGSSDWVLLGTSNTLIGAYSGSTTYTAGMEVTNSGNIFQALQATTGNAPPTPPATSAFWQLKGPSTLSNVPDGSGTYAGTAAGLSYRPNTNPLTSIDAGASATVDIASFLLVVRNRTVTSDVSYTSGSVTSLSYGTVYYIYCSDPTLAGGSVTYLATTTKETVLTGSGNVFIGSILTAVSGGGTTIGNNDGGSGSQYGNTTLVHPSAASGSFTNPINAIDGNPATVSSGTGASQALTASGFSGLVFPAIQSINAIVDWFSNASGGTAPTQILVSSNSGSSFTAAFTTSATFARTQTAVALGQNINPALYQIRVATGSGVSGSTGIDVYEIYLQEQY